MLRILIILAISIGWFAYWYKIMKKTYDSPIKALLNKIPTLSGSNEDIATTIVDIFKLLICSGPIGWIVLIYMIVKYVGFVTILFFVSAWKKLTSK
jgi:hypothetical protein